MRDFTNALRETVEPMWRQQEEKAAMHPADADGETFHVQADGFYGTEKGFHDAEQLRRQRERKN